MCELACVVHLGLTDDAAFGNVLLAQAGIPAIVLAYEELRALFADDVALICERNAIAEALRNSLAIAAARAVTESLSPPTPGGVFHRGEARFASSTCSARRASVWNAAPVPAPTLRFRPYPPPPGV